MQLLVIYMDQNARLSCYVNRKDQRVFVRQDFKHKFLNINSDRGQDEPCG